MINTKKLFLLTIIFSFVFAQGKALNSARVYIKDKDWKQAEKFLLEALEHPNDKWEAAYHLGDKVYVRSQDWAKVKQYLDLAGQAPEKLKIRPTRNDSRVPISTAVTASKTRSYLSIFNRAAGYNSLLGRATDPAKREALLDMAIKEASFAKEFDPKQPGAYYLLSVFYSLKQDKENTLKNINLGLGSDNIEDDQRLSLLIAGADAMSRLEDFPAAMSYLEQASQIDKNNPLIYKSLGALYAQQEQYENALETFDKAIDLIDNTDVEDQVKVDLYFNRGIVYLRMEDFDEAEYNFEEAYFLAPEDTEALFALARALEQSERWRKARSYYMDLIDLDSNNADYYYGVYRTYFGEGRLEDATEYLNKATALKGQ